MFLILNNNYIYKLMKDINKSSNKNFGIVFFVVFFLIGVYPLIYNDEINFWALSISFIFLILGLIKSRLLTPLNNLWFKFGILLGKIMSPFIMGAIFFLVVTPIGLLLKLFNKDVLNLSFNDKKSYWIEKNSTKSKMKNQF